MPPLKNGRHERFCLEIAEGCTQTEAARRAGYAVNSSVVTYRLINYPDVQARIKELREQAASVRVLSIVQGKERLSFIAQAKDARYRDVIDAIAELNKMDGAYATEKSEVKSQQVVVKTIEYFGPEYPPPPIEDEDVPQIAAP
jgi:phage terminase small subunit